MPIDPGLGDETIIENHPSVWVVDGEPRSGVNVVVSEDRWHEFRSGYRCLRCYGVQDEAFPEVCKARDLTGSWRCGFRMRDDQLRFLENETTTQRYGPSPDDDDYERENFKPSGDSRIWLPGDK